MKILYLPSNPKYRVFVERVLEFVEQVYRDEVLADLELIAYSPHDPRDLYEVRRRGIIERFSHYKPAVKLLVVAEHHGSEAVRVFVAVAEGVTNHALWGPFNVLRVVQALIKDIPRLKTIPRRVTSKDEAKLRIYVNTLYTRYAVDNYFVKLNDKPALMPWDSEILLDYIEAHYEEIRTRDILTGRRKREDAITAMLRIVYEEVIFKRNPLRKFREVVHEMFAGAIKRFPVEVYNSNPSRYKVLYSNQSIMELPL
jgi:hypothetical protein